MVQVATASNPSAARSKQASANNANSEEQRGSTVDNLKTDKAAMPAENKDISASTATRRNRSFNVRDKKSNRVQRSERNNSSDNASHFH